MTRRWLYLTCAAGVSTLAACSQDGPTPPTAATPAVAAPQQAPSMALAGGVSGANFTTTNPSWDRPKGGTRPELCLHGQDPQTGANNCNIYNAKPYVWLNGGPLTAGLESGEYFWAVLVPGGQPTPNDGGLKNLSDDTDPYTNRTFKWTKEGSVIEYKGTHDWDKTTNKLRVGVKPPIVPKGPDWFANTTNPGGVYILAICRISAPSSYPANPRDCKYDAFKIDDKPGVPAVQVAISPPTDVNPVGQPHTFKVAVKGVGNLPLSFAITPTVTPSAALQSETCSDPAKHTVVDDFNRECAVTVNSTQVGTVQLGVQAKVTDGSGNSATAITGPNSLPSSEDGFKYYVDAHIAVTPASATNRVTEQHTFAVTFTAAPGATTPTAFNYIKTSLAVPAGFTSPADYTEDSNTCSSPVVSGNVAQCEVKITSKKPGTYKLDAEGAVTMGADQDAVDPADPGDVQAGETIVRKTDGSTTPSGLVNSGPAVKYYANLRIILAPLTATNGVTEKHTVTALVEQNDGVNGWAVASGAPVQFAHMASGGAIPVPTTNSCTTGADGKCAATFVSATAGTVTTSAKTTVTVAGLPITRETSTPANTDAGGSGNALKDYVDGSISWVKVDEEGLPLGGAEFKAERIALRAGFTDPSFVPPSPVHAGIIDCVAACAPGAGKDQDPAKGKFKLTGLALGTWRVTETKAPANYTFNAAFYQDITIDLSNPPASLSGSAAQPFVNVGKYAGCTPGFWKQEQHFGYWHDSPFSPVGTKSLLSQAFSSFNGQGGYSPNATMLDALGWDNSTGVGQLLRHGTAALLNAYSTGVFYGFQDDPANIQAAVNAALQSGDQAKIDALHAKLAKYNELGCTLSGQKFW